MEEVTQSSLEGSTMQNVDDLCLKNIYPPLKPITLTTLNKPEPISRNSLQPNRILTTPFFFLEQWSISIFSNQTPLEPAFSTAVQILVTRTLGDYIREKTPRNYFFYFGRVHTSVLSRLWLDSLSRFFPLSKLFFFVGHYQSPSSIKLLRNRKVTKQWIPIPLFYP